MICRHYEFGLRDRLMPYLCPGPMFLAQKNVKYRGECFEYSEKSNILALLMFLDKMRDRSRKLHTEDSETGVNGKTIGVNVHGKIQREVTG